MTAAAGDGPADELSPEEQLAGIYGALEGQVHVAKAHSDELAGQKETLQGLSAALAALKKQRRNRPPNVASRTFRPRRGHRLPGDRVAGPLPWWDLDRLSPAAQHTLTSDTLAFGGWLKSTYRLDKLPSDWAAIPAYRTEILALYVSWVAAYKHRGAPPNSPNDWHEALARFTHRLADYSSLFNRPHPGDAGETAPFAPQQPPPARRALAPPARPPRTRFAPSYWPPLRAPADEQSNKRVKHQE